jgi:putative transposase
VVVLASSTFRYRPVSDKGEALRAPLWEIAETRVCYGFWRVYIPVRHKGWTVNHKLAYGLNKKKGSISVASDSYKSCPAAHCLDRVEAVRLNKSWSMDFGKAYTPIKNDTCFVGNDQGSLYWQDRY